MTGSEQAAKQYLHKVRQHLDVPQADQERFMERLTKAISVYLEENEDAGPDALAAAFGQPEVCASQLLGEIDPAVVTATRQKRKRRQHIILGVLAALVVLLTGFSLYLYSTGGLVFIIHTHYASPEDMPPPPESGTITFHYEYEDGD